MRKLKSNFGIIAFVLVAVLATSAVFISSASSQERRKDNDVSISWSPKKRDIKTADSKLTLNLPDSLANQDWVVGVMPAKEGENETLVVGAVSWKDSNMGAQTVIENVTDIPDDSMTLSKGQANLANANEFSSKSMLILLTVKPGTQISLTQKGEQISMATSTNEGSIIAKETQRGLQSIGIKKITGVSSLMGELQTRKFMQRFGGK
ncbi:MAG TPA: hypothetical protein PKE69_01880 [Pyrinomonadaceae bacterium]|nr:hypothetical protein [Pyrinomonadaceae bacterium]